MARGHMKNDYGTAANRFSPMGPTNHEYIMYSPHLSYKCRVLRPTHKNCAFSDFHREILSHGV